MLRTALGLLVSTLLLCGCTGKARIFAQAQQYGPSLEVKVSVEPFTKGTLHFKGSPAFEKLGAIPVEQAGLLVLKVPLGGVPRGKNTVTMEFEGEGRGLAKKIVGTDTLSFDKVGGQTLRLVGVPKSGARELTCKGALCTGGTTIPFGPDAKLSVDLTECEGCDVDVGGQKISVRGPHAASSIDLTNAIGGAPAPKPLEDLKVPFKITFEGETTEVAFEASSSILLGTVLRRVAQGPLAFAGDAAAGPPRSALFVPRTAEGQSSLRSFGPAARVRDFDLVGLAAETESTMGSCGVYTQTDSKAKVIVEHRGISLDVTMYDRRTGRTLGRRSFPPQNKGCAERLIGDAKASYAFPAEEAIGAWVRSLLK